MKHRMLFLQWALFVSLLGVASAIIARLGWWDMVFKDDPTHFTSAVLALFIAVTARNGRLCWRFHTLDPGKVRRAVDGSWFASSACVTIGLLGTVLGYMIMMRGVTGEGPDMAEQLVRQIKTGLGTVLINTFLGGVCGLLLEVQSHFIAARIPQEPQEPEAP